MKIASILVLKFLLHVGSLSERVCMGREVVPNWRLINLSASFGVSYDDFNILAVAPDLVNLRILESFHIFKSKPKLNDSNNSFPLNFVQ